MRHVQIIFNLSVFEDAIIVLPIIMIKKSFLTVNFIFFLICSFLNNLNSDSLHEKYHFSRSISFSNPELNTIMHKLTVQFSTLKILFLTNWLSLSFIIQRGTRWSLSNL